VALVVSNAANATSGAGDGTGSLHGGNRAVVRAVIRRGGNRMVEIAWWKPQRWKSCGGNRATGGI
jgi:hypothetical protein